MKVTDEMVHAADNVLNRHGVRKINDDTIRLAIVAALSTVEKVETPAQGTPAPETHLGGWDYDLSAAPNGLMEFAFTNSLGLVNVRICERIGHHTDYGIHYMYHEDGRPNVDLNANGWRAFAWRSIDVPPVEPSPQTREAG